MIKFISSFLAKRWLEKHKDDNATLGIGNQVVSGIDFYGDIMLYIVLYGIFLLLLLFGVPIGVLFLTGYAIGWTILSFFVSWIVGIIITYKVIKGVIMVFQDEVLKTIKLMKNENKL